MKWTNPGKEFKFGKIFSKKNKIYLYGAGHYGKQYLSTLKKLNLFEAFDGYIDRDLHKQNDGVLGYPVINPSILFEKRVDDHIIFLSILDENIRERISKRLSQAGYIYGIDFFDLEKDESTFQKVKNCFMAYALGKVCLSSSCCIPSTICNLSCRDCLNFTPFLKNMESRDLNTVCKDEELFFYWINYVDRFQISGGEPLLYQDLSKLIEYLGQNHRNKIGIFEIVFNGTIIPDDNICKTMADYRMRVILDDYRENIPTEINKREQIITKLDQFGVEWVDNYVPEWFTLDIFNTNNSTMTDEELCEYFDFCGNPWHYYQNGKLYSCNFSAFAMKAGIINETENDYFDLTQDNTRENRIRLFEFSQRYNKKGYVDFCKQCAGWGPFNHQKRVPVAIQIDKKH